MDHLLTAPPAWKQQNGENGLVHKGQLSGKGRVDVDCKQSAGMDTLTALSRATAKVSSKVSSGPLPLSFFGEEEESDPSNQTVEASTGSDGVVQVTDSNGERKESRNVIDNESGLDTDDDFEFGDFESVPAQFATSGSSSHMPVVDSSKLMLQLHGSAVPAAVQHHSPVQLHQALQPVSGDGFDDAPSSAWPAPSSGFEGISNGIHEESDTMIDHLDESMCDDEWGDFVAPVASVSAASLLENTAWDVHISNYRESNHDPKENVSPAAAGADAAQSQPCVTTSGTSATGPRLASTPESVTNELHDPFSFDGVLVVSDVSSVKVEETASYHIQSGPGKDAPDLKIQRTPILSPLDLFVDKSDLWNPLARDELGLSRVTKTSTPLPDFGESSNEMDSNEVTPEKGMEDEDVWDWVAADTRSNHVEANPMKIADGFVGISISAPDNGVPSNNRANRRSSSGETDSEQVPLSPSGQPDVPVSSSLLGASVDVQSTLSTEADMESSSVKARQSAVPLPLSLFGEDELQYNPSLVLEPELILSREQSKNGRIQRSQSFKLQSSNFSDLIASLYPHHNAPEKNSKKTSHRRSRSTSIQASSSDDVDFFFSKVDSHPLESPAAECNAQDGIQKSLESDAGILPSYSSMLDADATSEDGVDDEAALESSVSSPQGKGLGSHGTPLLEDLLNMDVHLALDGSVSIEDIFLGGFSFHYTEEDDMGPDMASVKPVNVDKRGNDTISALQKLTLCLMSEGRVCEAHYCKKHTSAVSCLPDLQEAYSNAIEVGEFEKAAATAKEIEVARTNLRGPEDLKQWKSRKRHVKTCPVDQTAHEQVCSSGLSVITIDEMVELLGDHRSDARAAVLKSLFDAQEVNKLAESDLGAAVELQAHAVHTFRILACASSDEQELCVTAWGQLASVCAGELEHALYIWQSAVTAEAQTRLLDMPQGKSFFSAVGQIYVVSCVLSATLKVYKPWLAVAKEQGQAASKALERCHTVWLESSLREAVRLSLVSSIHILPMTAASWVEIQKLPRAAKTAIIQAAGRSVSDRSSDRFCGLSLLPLLPFTAIPAVEWEGRHYLLPLANLWANTISPKAPGLPLLKIGEVRA